MSENSNLSNLRKFYESTALEIIAIKDRVRDLIGDANWGEEGAYKESFLRNILRRVIPKSYTIGSGFIVKIDNDQVQSSTQIDVLIIDNKFPVLFSEEDFYIVSPNSVRAAIEVKTNAKNQRLKQIIEKMNKIGNFLSSTNPDRSIFNGIFSFEGDYSERYIKNNVKNDINGNYVNHISLNNNLFLKLWRSSTQNNYSVYKFENLSFSFFISNLISYLTRTTFTEVESRDERRLLYPVDKEEDLWFNISLTQENE